MHEIEFRGIDGSNLLGFLAAVGALRVLSQQGGIAVWLSWRERSYWTPVLHSELADEDAVTEQLATLVCGTATLNSVCSLAKDLRCSRAMFREWLQRYSADRISSDFLCAFGSDAFASGKDDQINDTDFRTMSGAGHQHFLGTMAELAEITEPEHVRRALFEAWDYSDERPSMRWDPADYRPHALRAQDPSGDPIRTMRGANRLAIEALPLFPTAPGLRKLRTTGFQFRDGQVEITWPIWTDALDLDTVRSVFGLADLQSKDGGLELRQRGIAEAFRARRFTEGKFRNFSPSKMVG